MTGPAVLPAWTIRQASQCDAQTISQHRYDHRASQDDHDAYTAWVKEAIARNIYVGLFAECNGRVIGGAGLQLMEWGPVRGDPSPLRGRLVNVWTEPEWRRVGVAKALALAVLDHARQLGVQTVGLGATPLSESVYRSIGFTPYPVEMRWRAVDPPEH
jgi:GNAT superfamily N-acetyltransferase